MHIFTAFWFCTITVPYDSPFSCTLTPNWTIVAFQNFWAMSEDWQLAKKQTPVDLSVSVHRSLKANLFTYWHINSQVLQADPKRFCKSADTSPFKRSICSSTHLRWLFFLQYNLWWILQWLSLGSHNTFTCQRKINNCLKVAIIMCQTFLERNVTWRWHAWKMQLNSGFQFMLDLKDTHQCTNLLASNTNCK